MQSILSLCHMLVVMRFGHVKLGRIHADLSCSLLLDIPAQQNKALSTIGVGFR